MTTVFKMKPTGWQPQLQTAAAILDTEFREVRYVVPGLIPEGTYLLVSRPKVGKSWLAMQLTLAVGTKGVMFGRAVEQGKVIYLALEDNPRRIQKRLKKLLADRLINPEDLANIAFETVWSRGIDAAADLAVLLEKHKSTRLVIIDTLERVRERGPANGNQYSDDYSSIAPFKALSDRFGVTVLIVHHVRKGESEDPLDSVSGTLGLTGAADGVLVLKRQRGESRGELHLIGRDVEEEGCFVVEFCKETCCWELLGEAHDVADTEEQQAVLNIVRELQPIQPREIADELNRNGATVRRFLQKLRRTGKVQKTPKGYVIPASDEQGEQGERNEQ